MTKRKTSSTATVHFSDAARAAGLHLRGISQASVQLLARIQSEPIPIQKRQRGKNNQPSPSGKPSCSIGPLITNGLAIMRGDFYYATEKGSDYLTKMKVAGLLNVKTVATCATGDTNEAKDS